MDSLRDHSAVPDMERAANAAGERARRIMEHAVRRYEPTKSQKQAYATLGTLDIGVRDAMEHFGLAFSDEELCQLSDVPFPKDALRSAATNHAHLLVAMPPISIADMSIVLPHSFFKEPFDAAWYKDHMFAVQKAGAGGLSWHLINTAPLKNSEGKPPAEQELMCPRSERIVEDAVLLTYAAVGYYKKTGERLFTKWVRTSDVLTSGGVRAHDSELVFVTFRFGEDGIEFGTCPEKAHVGDCRPVVTEVIPPGGFGPFD